MQEDIKKLIIDAQQGAYEKAAQWTKQLIERI